MWWYRGEAKVAGQLVAEAEIGAMLSIAMTRAVIDPTARGASGRRHWAGVTIGPYCVIGGNVTIGDGCTLVAGQRPGHTTIGPGTRIAPFTSLGGATAIGHAIAAARRRW